MCWECFECHLQHALEPDQVGESLNETNGNLICPNHQCHEEITLFKLANNNAPGEVFDLLEKLKLNFETKRIVHQALKDQEDRLTKDFNSLMTIQDNDEREAARLRLEVVENILTLRCPRCKMAFVDYTGCAALECTNCKAAFCALCLKDCGKNAHVRKNLCYISEKQGYFNTNIF